MKRKIQSWGPGIIPLVIGIAIVFITLFGGQWIMGADKEPHLDSIWIEIKPPQEESKGQALRMVCPICGQCYPKEPSTLLMTAMWCPGRCCNVMTLEYHCRTYKDSVFTIKIGECDGIKWGRTIAKKDVDSLVDKSDWTIKKKK